MFLFTDIEGSTALWERDRRGMGAAVARHDALVREVVDAGRGYVFTTAGDSFAVAFGRVAAAVEAAVEIQKRLAVEQWPTDVQLRVRMGVHVGESEERDGDDFGPAVNRAARLMGLAYGAQVLVSRAVADLASEIDGVIGFRDLGEHALRGLSRPESIYQVIEPGLGDDFPALDSGAGVVGNLPEPATSFVGRVGEVRRLVAALESGRLVTLLGPGGVGKTRLSIEAWSAASDEFPDGVWFVALAPLAEPDAVVHALASLLSVQPEEGRSLLDSTVAMLGERRALVVMDNCEHLVDAAVEMVAALLAGTKRVVVLASSREPLEVAGEQAWPVGPLDAALEAVELFVDRAQAVNPAFTVDGTERELVGELCGRLDGIPLAIELAAARTRSMTVSELARGLDDRFRLLRGSRRRSRDVDDRHRTLHATVEWSYQLLNEDEQLLFDRLSVFAGEFDAAAAEAICAGEQLDKFDVTDLLESLVARSMIQADQSTGTTRFRLLETLRQYGEAKLSERQEVDQVRSRHLAHYVGVAARARGDFEGTTSEAGRRCFHAEWDNLRAALEHAETTSDEDAANQLVRDSWFYSMLTKTSEHLDWTYRRTAPPNQPTAEVLGGASFWAVTTTDYNLAAELADRAVDRAPSPDDPTAALGWMGAFYAAHYAGGHPGAAQAADRAAKSAVARGSDPFLTAFLTTIPYSAIAFEPETALNLVESAARTASPLNNPVLDCEIAAYRGYVLHETGNPRAALTEWKRAAELGERSGNHVREAWAMAMLAIRSPLITSEDPTQLFHTVLERVHRIGMYSFARWTLGGLAAWWARTGDLEAAGHILGYLDHDDPRGNPMVADLRGQAAATIAAHPDQATWRATGTTMSLDDAVAYSLTRLH